MKWNVQEINSVTIARLLSELEGVTYILECINEPEEYEYMQKMKQKYYKEYFKRVKSEKINLNNTISG
jgi:hypothetical protein